MSSGITNITQVFKKNTDNLIKLLTLLSFIIPFLVLYFLYPYSFEATWKGRTYYLFFLWLFFLEMILSWEQLQTKKWKLKSIRTVALIIALLLPSIYVVAANYFGLNTMIVNLAVQYNVPLADWMPLATEYLVFTALFASIILLAYGIHGLIDFAISAFFLGIIGVIYTIDNLYPEGSFTPFQFLVPTTARLAATVLNLLGYQTHWFGIYGGMPTFIAWDSQGRYSLPFSIAWPCSGIESLVIYTVIMLLFLKKSNISWIRRIIYFVIGAIVTYFINILRIVTIYVISINAGNIWRFHDYYGQLYSIAWIISYPLLITFLHSRTFSRLPRFHKCFILFALSVSIMFVVLAVVGGLSA